MTRINIQEKTPLGSAHEIVKAIIKDALLDSKDPMVEMTAYLTETEGKNIRAQMLLISSADDFGLVPKNAIIAAAALEILHLASLVHDDVIDDADMRRGQLSVPKAFGNKSAVLCGDYLFCKSFMLVADISGAYQERFLDVAKAMTKICLGELREFRHNNDTSLSVREYFRIVAGKTSALFALSMYAGAILGGYDKVQASRLMRFGHYVGMLFQLTDDCIDYQTQSSVAGKSVLNDLAQGTVTLPLIFAIAKEPSLRDEIGRGLTPEAVKLVIEKVISLGGIEKTIETTDKYGAKAAKLLTALPEGIRRAQLELLLGHILKRKY